MKKANPAYKHFNYRLKQRFDIKIDREYYDILCKKCRNKDNSIKFIKKDKYKNRVILKTSLKDKEVFLVYDKERCRIYTAMTKEMVGNI